VPVRALPPMRCAPCRKVDHAHCQGDEVGCTCQSCHGRQIAAEAREAFLRSQDAPVLAWHLGRLLSLQAQRWRRVQLARPQATLQGYCPECGQAVIGSRTGRRKIYDRRACIVRAYRQRRAERLQDAAGPVPAPQQAPARVRRS